MAFVRLRGIGLMWEGRGNEKPEDLSEVEMRRPWSRRFPDGHKGGRFKWLGLWTLAMNTRVSLSKCVRWKHCAPAT